MYLNPTQSNLNSLYSTYQITYENDENQVEYLFTCIHPKCATVCHTGGSAGEGVRQLEQMSLFALIVNYWCRTLYCPKQAQTMLLQCLNVTSFSLFFRKL